MSLTREPRLARAVTGALGQCDKPIKYAIRGRMFIATRHIRVVKSAGIC